MKEMGGVDGEIRKMLTKEKTKGGGEAEAEVLEAEEHLGPKEVQEVIGLLRQLEKQYDELLSYIKHPKLEPEAEGREKGKEGEGLQEVPVEFTSSLIRSTRISPTLIKIVTLLTAENKELREAQKEKERKLEALKEEKQRTHEDERARKMELKYMEQTITEMSGMIENLKGDKERGRKRVLELETAFDEVKKMNKELLKAKKEIYREVELHEKEAELLRKLLEEKEAAEEEGRKKAMGLEQDLKKAKRESDVLKIQNDRLAKRVEIKDGALDACNKELMGMINKLEKTARADAERSERMEYLSIINKRLEYENKELKAHRKRGPVGPVKREKSGTKEDAELEVQNFFGEEEVREKAQSAEEVSPEPVKPLAASGKPLPPEPIQEAAATRARQSAGALEEPIASGSFEKAIEEPSFPSSSTDDTQATDRTTTSFREMRSKTEQMAKKFLELDSLLQEIKRGNESELEKVEKQINRFNDYLRK